MPVSGKGLGMDMEIRCGRTLRELLDYYCYCRFYCPQASSSVSEVLINTM